MSFHNTAHGPLTGSNCIITSLVSCARQLLWSQNTPKTTFGT